MTATTAVDREAAERSPWRAVALPSEHGGWGLTLEPVLLGLLVAWSAAGLALGVAAFAAFLLRTPLKLVVVDRRRHRWLRRSELALRIAACEFAVMAGAAIVATVRSGLWWTVPVLVAMPFVAVEWWFDVRSRGRRLVPELCGAVGISAIAAAIVVAGGRGAHLAVAMSLVLGARAVGAIPFVRVQIQRLRRGAGPAWQSDLAQVAAMGIVAVAVAVDRRALAGAVGVAVLGMLQIVWVRTAPVPAKRLGIRQMALGLSLVAVTSIGVLW